MPDLRFEDFLVHMCQTIKQMRKEKGLTQEVVASRIKAPQSMVARFESGKINDAHISLVYRICEAIGEDIGTVLTQAIRTTIVNQSDIGENSNFNWEVLKENVELLKEQDRRELVEVFTRVFKLAHGADRTDT